MPARSGHFCTILLAFSFLVEVNRVNSALTHGGRAKRMSKLFVNLLAVILCWAEVSFANEVALFETQSAVASFVAEESACVRTLTNVFASNHIERPQKTPASGAFLSITKQN